MAIDRKLLDVLCCPVTGQPLQVLGKDRLQQLNTLIEQGKIRQYDNAEVSRPLQEALITENGERIYRVEDGIPVMLEEQAISARQLQDQ